MTENANPLTEYLERTGTSLSGFALRMGKSPSTLLRALNGERNPSVKLAKLVERTSDGEVTASQFLNTCLSAVPTPERKGAAS